MSSTPPFSCLSDIVAREFTTNSNVAELKRKYGLEGDTDSIYIKPNKCSKADSINCGDHNNDDVAKDNLSPINLRDKELPLIDSISMEPTSLEEMYKVFNKQPAKLQPLPTIDMVDDTADFERILSLLKGPPNRVITNGKTNDGD